MSDALAAWTPLLRVFLRRSLIVGTLTVGPIAVFGYVLGAWTGIWEVLQLGPFLAATYIILVEDPARWRGARQDRWHLRSDAIIHHGPDGEVRIPLADVVDVRTRLGWSVVLFLKDGLRVRIAYVPDPKNIAAQILAARARLTP